MGSFFKRQFFFVFLMPGNLASIQVVNLLLIVKLGCKHWSSFHSSDLASGHFGETALMACTLVDRLNSFVTQA